MIGAAVLLHFYLRHPSENLPENLPENASENASDDVPLIGTYETWASALDEPQCAHVSKEIYDLGGNVAEATVASLLCLGVVLPESLGIGGGFFALYFKK